jgi:23S rRNA (cytosine1962-C5)-methyltransferase
MEHASKAVAKVILLPGKEESVLRFHPWIFSGAIRCIDGTPEEGEVVEVYDSRLQFLAVGHYQPGSITVRILSFRQRTVDRDFWRERIGAACDLRKALNLAGNDRSDAYRLVHGEGDMLSGLVVDVYGHTAVIQAHSAGMHHVRMELAEVIREIVPGEIRHIYYKSEATLPFKAQLGAENAYLMGGEDADDIATENGFKFYVDFEKGQKTGFYIDQRENRMLLERYAKGRRVLNMFCYTGGFSFYAMRGGALKIHSVDSSAKVVQAACRNIDLNFPGDTRHEAFTEDAFRYLENTEEEYDLIVLDPPAFAKHRQVLRNALQGYRKLNALAIEKIRPGGIIFTFSCSQVVTKEDFRATAFSAAARTGRKVRILHQLTQPADHPISIYHPESEYLKGLVLQVE